MEIDHLINEDALLAKWAPFIVFIALTALMVFPAVFAEESVQRNLASDVQRIGTMVMFVLLPVYLTISMQQLARRSRDHLLSLRDAVDEPLLEQLNGKLSRLTFVALLAACLGFLFGIYQNRTIIKGMLSGEAGGVDLAVLIGNGVLWSLVALVVAWRLPQSLALYRIGETARYDVRFPDQMVPFSRIAMMDVLVVAGALVFLPLQSLDAEFRLHNYLPGLIVAMTSATLMMLAPLLGVRKVIVKARHDALERIDQAIKALPDDDIVANETLLSYRDRIYSLPGLPMNVALVTRLVGYLFLAPLAWVLSAYIESLF